jgi:hypothetical protein
MPQSGTARISSHVEHDGWKAAPDGETARNEVSS